MGAILWQGPHHDAVKSTTTSLETHRNKRESREKPAAAESESRVPTIWGGEGGGWVGSELL